MIQKALHFFQKEQIIWGISSLLITLSLSIKTAIPVDLLSIGIMGLFLSSRLRLKGFFYSILILSFVACFRHVFTVTDHLYQLGIESSFALAFLVIALSKEDAETTAKSIEQRMDTKEAMIHNLEDELVKFKDETQHQQIAFQEKIFSLQKELEEIHSEHSSILILNDVLRKTTAKHIGESDETKHNLFELTRTNRLLKEEILDAEKEILRLKNSDALSIENKQLKKELNDARFQKEQTTILNETLNRLHHKECLKSKEAEEEASLLTALCKDREKAYLDLEDKVLKQEFEIENLKAENELIKTEVVPFDPNELEDLEKTKERLKTIEPLYKQLKEQFEEKTKLLHEVRSDLFKTETELQKSQIDWKLHLDDPIPKEISSELAQLAEKILDLEEENQRLLEIISAISETAPEEKVKKKVNKKTLSEQGFLF